MIFKVVEESNRFLAETLFSLKLTNSIGFSTSSSVNMYENNPASGTFIPTFLEKVESVSVTHVKHTKDALDGELRL